MLTEQQVKETAERLSITVEELRSRFPALADKDDPNWNQLYQKEEGEPFWQQ